MRLLTKTMLTMSIAAVVAGCGDQIGPKLEQTPQVTEAVARFDPTVGASGIPFPVDLMFSDTVDGSVNIPGADTNSAYAAMNTLNGFSTTAPMVIRFSAAVDNPDNADDVSDGILVFETDATAPGATVGAIDRALVFGVDYAAGISSGTTGFVFPLKPLTPGKTHLVVVTDDLETKYGGNPVGSDSIYALGKGSFSLYRTGALGVVLLGAVPNFAVAGEASVTTACDFDETATDETATLAACVLNPAYSGLAGLDETNDTYAPYLEAILGARQIVAALEPLFAAKDAALVASDMAAFQTAMTSIGTLDTLRGQIGEDLAALAAASVDITKVVLSYRVTTQDIGSAQAQAKAQVAASSPTLTVLNKLSQWTLFPTIAVVSPGEDGEVNDAGDHSAHIYLAKLSGILQFVDPAEANTSHWEADEASWLPVSPCTGMEASTKLLGCNQFKPAPKVSDHAIPVLISVPRIESLNPALDPDNDFPDCAAPLPVVIFQHGITANRGSLMGLADTLANACVVGVAIDLPKHGISSADSTFAGLGVMQSALSSGTVLERLVKVESPATECQAGTGAAVGDGDYYCPSGDNFVNLTDLANARDTLRQGAIDLHSLYKALVDDAGSALNADSIGTTIDADNIHFVGMSLGGIVGALFAANEPDLATVTLNVSGGGIAKILDGSPSFEPQITAGLAASGITKPGANYEGFMIMAQTVVDSADPINYTAGLASHQLLMQEVLNDQVVPNNTFGTSFGPAWGFVAQTGQNSFLLNQNYLTVPVALSGSDALAQGTGFVVGAAVANQNPTLAGNVLGAGVLGGDGIIAAVNTYYPDTFPASTSTFKGAGLPSITGDCAAAKGIVRFTQGSHSSLLQTGSTPAVTAAMQTQIATLVTQGAAALPSDASALVFKGDVASASDYPCAP